jgi:hypothetical protein
MSLVPHGCGQNFILKFGLTKTFLRESINFPLRVVLLLIILKSLLLAFVIFNNFLNSFGHEIPMFC